jgi:ribonuclease HI
MTWSRMSFKGQVVWVRADDGGRPVLDADGRAEMKYRESDTRSYRPLPQNLGSRCAGQAVEPAKPAKAAASSAQAARGKAGTVSIAVAVVGFGIGNRARVDRRRLLRKPRAHGHRCRGGGGRPAQGTRRVPGQGHQQHRRAHGHPPRPGDRGRALLRPGSPVRVYTDSSYAIGLLSQGWKAKANQELVAELREFLRGFRNLRMIKVEGHAGVPENERCDLLARQAVAQNRF